ncbi:MAG: hypothetical protein AAGC88_10005 [Bacteroidota bacterium]
MKAERTIDQKLVGQTLNIFVVEDELYFPVDQYCYKFGLSLLKQVISIQSNEDISNRLVKNQVHDKLGNQLYSGFLLPCHSFLIWFFQIAEKSNEHNQAKLELSTVIASMVKNKKVGLLTLAQPK